MKKVELLREVSLRASEILEKKVSQKDIEGILAAYTDCVFETLDVDREEKIPLPGVGNFSVKHVKERTGVIRLGEKTGEQYTTPAHDEVAFKMSKTVRGLE